MIDFVGVVYGAANQNIDTDSCLMKNINKLCKPSSNKCHFPFDDVHGGPGGWAKL